jgi:hypothetical protein
MNAEVVLTQIVEGLPGRPLELCFVSTVPGE